MTKAEFKPQHFWYEICDERNITCDYVIATFYQVYVRNVAVLLFSYCLSHAHKLQRTKRTLNKMLRWRNCLQWTKCTTHETNAKCGFEIEIVTELTWTAVQLFKVQQQFDSTLNDDSSLTSKRRVKLRVSSALCYGKFSAHPKRKKSFAQFVEL